MNTKAMRSNFLLLLTALIWGLAFVAQSVGMDYVGPFTFTAARSWIGGLALIPCIRLLDRISPRKVTDENGHQTHGGKNLIYGGIACGICLAVASMLQQIGINYTTVGKAGFLTAMYILIVPVLGIFIRQKVPARIWLCIVLAIFGLYLLCMTESFSLGKGDILELLCALGYSFHILTIDHFSPKVDGVRMSCIQFFVCAVICTIPALIFESPDMGNILAAWMPILYAGVLSSGAGYTLQIIAQKDTDPVIASLLMSLESTFSVLAGWVILHQYLSGKELCGCLLMFLAIMLAQIPVENILKKRL